MSHGMAAVGGTLYLARHFRMLTLYLGELVGIDGIGQGTACVEKHLVFNTGKGAYLNIRYVFAQLIFQSLARGVGIVVKDYLFTFLSDPRVPYENNGSERGVRKIKIKQKVCGCFRTDKGADDFAKLHFIAETAMKNGNSKYNAILAVVQQ